MRTEFGFLSLDFDKGNTLVALNDNGVSFKEIAEIIEKEWEEL